ncbi:MAG TPA: ABC transporter ATP-binding protein [Thermoanaerobaculia bacterium]|nr:ABC transporter ATP-binding protein [Thermoanaerobaculia bacterium]
MPAETSVEIRGLTKRFGDVAAVDGVSLDIRKGEFFSLLGPSGCGKTTLLRMIGGFELPTEGSIAIGGQDLTWAPPYRRPVNMVFQHYALFPHLSVGDNVAFGMRYKGIARADEGRRVTAALSLVQLAGYEKRLPSQLSGGQRQRVALARALALEPEVLLLDEPLGALDQKLRKEVQVQLKHLQRSLGITFIFVTHDQEEALTMSDRIAVMNRGRVEQLDEAARIFERPATEFVANFMGAANFFAARVDAVAAGGVTLALKAGGGLRLPGAAGALRPGDDVRFVVRPEKLDLRAHDLSRRGVPCLPVTVEDRVYQGVSTVWIVRDAADERFTVYAQNEKPFEQGAGFGVGAKAFLCWNAAHAVLLGGGAAR